MSKNEEKNTVVEEKKSSTDLSPKIKDFITSIENLTVLELSQLVESLEEKFGVSAAVAMPVVAGGSQGGGDSAQPEEKTSFDVILSSFGDKKIAVIKEVRSLTGLGLKEAKALVDSCPKPVKEGIKKEEANTMKEALEKSGATVEIK